MKNILFVLYEDFHCNSALHIHEFANNLVMSGFDCVVTVPHNKHTIASLSSQSPHLYNYNEFWELYKLPEYFKNYQGPDLVHIWNPREINRSYWEKLKKIYPNCKLVIHLEDNEEFITEKYLNRPWADLIAEGESLVVPDNVSHPVKYQEFLASADGVTIIIDKLKEFVPPQVPHLVLWPGADTEHFSPRPPNQDLLKRFHISPEQMVFCYTGNVHAANTLEVRSLYLAVAMLNRQGTPAVLMRTGQDFCQFLGENDRWARQYSRELGYVDRSTLPEILSLATVLIQPGRPDKFNDYRFPCKLPEFLSMGKPVILPATNIGLEMQHKQDALVLPAVNAIPIVETVELLLQDNDLYQQLSQGALNFTEKYLNWQHNTKLLRDFYRSL